MIIGERIAKVIFEKNISKKELAQRLNIKPQTLSSVLRSDNINTKTLERIADALEVSICKFFSLEMSSDSTVEDYNNHDSSQNNRTANNTIIHQYEYKIVALEHELKGLKQTNENLQQMLTLKDKIIQLLESGSN